MAIDFIAFPPASEAKRLLAYDRYEKLFLGQHRELYAPGVPGKYQLRRYIVANFAGLISRFCADLLFGEQPDFLAPTGDEEIDAELDNADHIAAETQHLAARGGTARGAADVEAKRERRQALAAEARQKLADDVRQQALDDLIQRNNLHTTNLESALGNSFRGDAVYKVRWGLRTPNAAEPEAIIEEIPPSIYFPELNEDNVREVMRATLAWVKVDLRDKAKRYLRVEEHEPGVIRNRLLLFNGASAQQEVPLETLEVYAGLEPEVQTGLDVIPVFHAPNFVYGSRFWGISDYQDLEPLFEALDERLSQTDEVLSKHLAPKLVLPPRFINEDGTVNLGELEVVQLEAGEQPPTYVTWDAHLSAASAQIDRITELIFIMSEIAPVAFGLEKYGTAQSGTALRLRLLRTLAKVNRKRQYYDRALKSAVLCAQQLEVKHGGATYEPAEPMISWADGLPEDMMEMTQIETQRLTAGNTSIESSIRRLDGPDAVEAELDRIAEEEGQRVTVMGPAPGQGPPPQPAPTPEPPPEPTPAAQLAARGIEVDQ